MEPLAKLFLCHPERSEESQPYENTRFFVQPSITGAANKEFCKSLQGIYFQGTHFRKERFSLGRGDFKDQVCDNMMLKSAPMQL